MISNYSNPVTVCADLSIAARQILEHSFSILRLDDETYDALKETWIAAREFLSSKLDECESSTNSQEATTIMEYRRIQKGALLGYNRPSSRKLLYRSLFVNCKPDGFQPWPDDLDNGALKTSSSALARHFHGILLGCLKELEMLTNNNHAEEDEQMQHGRRTKKRKVEKSVQSLHFDTAQCPLDCFLYHSQRDGVNCSEHVDRGALICISLTNVCGLEVLSNADDNRNWICPEKVFANESLFSERECGCSNMVCILSGDQLKQYLKADIGNTGTMIANCHGLNACIHRVKPKLSASRLSISYELRGKHRLEFE